MKKNAELVFFSKWLTSPLSVAAVTPSSPRLAKAMAKCLPEGDGLVVELGGGTGPITHALLQAGVAPERLVVIERDPFFCRHLATRFPGITVLEGDALNTAALVESLGSTQTTRAVVSGLPLLAMSPLEQMQLLQEVLKISSPLTPFIQFSYSLSSPLKLSLQNALGLSAKCAAQVWRNVPPAKVWLYTQTEAASVSGTNDAQAHATAMGS